MYRELTIWQAQLGRYIGSQDRGSLMEDPENARPLPVTQHIESCDGGLWSPENAGESCLCCSLSPVTFCNIAVSSTSLITPVTPSWEWLRVTLSTGVPYNQLFITRSCSWPGLSFPRFLGYAELTTKWILKPALKLQKPEVPKTVRRTVVQSLTSYQTNKKMVISVCT